jgi:hypothetical protein
VPTDPDAIAYLAAISAQHSSKQKQAIDTFIKGMKAASLWTRLDRFHLAVKGAQAVTIDMKSALSKATVNGTMTFTDGIGAKGDGSTGYIGSGFIPSTAGGNFQRDSHLIGGFVADPNAVGNNFLVGTLSSSFGPRFRVSATNSGLFAANGYSGNGQTMFGPSFLKSIPNVADISRTGSTAVSIASNGVPGTPDATASTGIDAQELWFMRNGSTYNGVETFVAGWIAGGMVDADRAVFHGLVRDLLIGMQNWVFCFGDSLTECKVPGGSQIANPWPSILQSALGIPFSNQGTAGEPSSAGGGTTGIRPRQIADLFGNHAAEVIWSGKNNVADPTTVLADDDLMIAHLATSRFIMIGITPTTGSDASSGQTNYAARMQINNARQTKYGAQYLDLLPALQAGGDGSANDNADIAAGAIPRSLMIDTTHPFGVPANSRGFTGPQIIADAIRTKGAALGYW